MFDANVTIDTALQQLLTTCVEMAGLLHDFGKATELFNKKLMAAQRSADVLRHEYISSVIFQKIVFGSSSSARPDVEWLRDLTGASCQKTLADAYSKGLKETASIAAKISQTCSTPKFFPDRCEEKIYQAIWWLILTHHRPLYSNVNFGGRSQSSRYSLKKHVNDKEEQQAKFITIPKKLPSITSDTAWVEGIQVCANRIIELLEKQTDTLVSLPGLVTYARPMLILGDHFASQDGKPQDKTNLGKYVLAKSPGQKKREHTQTTKEHTDGGVPLVEHVRDVADAASKSLRGFMKLRGAAPMLSTMPERISNPLPTNISSPFAWQGESRSQIQIQQVPKHGGFVGNVLAGTGRGKTLGAAIIATALDSRPRITVCLSLRKLTLQTGKSYQEDLGFKAKDVAVTIGDPVIKALFDLSDVMASKETKETLIALTDQDDKNNLEIDADECAVAIDGHAPLVLEGLMADYVAHTPKAEQDSMARYLGCPILITTIDSLMGIAAGFDTRRLHHALRLMSSHVLVIDEIDSFSETDQAAIGRLVWVAGTYGVKVIIMSATMPPATAEAMFRSCYAGYMEYTNLFGIKNGRVACAWIPDDPQHIKVKASQGASDFRPEHDAVIAGLVSTMTSKPVKRRVELLTTANTSEKDMFESVFEKAKEHHHEYHVTTEDGRNVSIGFVRWANVKPARNFAKFLDMQQEDGISHRIICYHSRHKTVIRNEMECFLDDVCNRKTGHDAFLANEHVKAALVETKGDLMIIVSCTGIMEVGRDYDFDWAIVDPSGMRLLIQVIGRVNRHGQREECINISLIDEPYRARNNAWCGKTDKPAFIYPGVEEHEDGSPWRLDSTLSANVFDLTTLGQSADARDCLSIPDKNTSPIGWMEHEKLASYLLDGVGSLMQWVEGAVTYRLSSWHERSCRFRASSMEDYSFWTDSNGHWNLTTAIGVDKKVDSQVIDAKEGTHFLLPLDSKKLFAEVSPKIFRDCPTGKRAHKALDGFVVSGYNKENAIVEYSDQLGADWAGSDQADN